MGSHLQEGNNHSLVFKSGFRPSAPLCQSFAQAHLPSSSHEEELEHVVVPVVGPGTSGSSAGNQEFGSRQTGCALCGSVGGEHASEANMDNKAIGPSMGEGRSTGQQSVLISKDRSGCKEAGTEGSRNSQIGVKSLKVRFSLGPKLIAKKIAGESEPGLSSVKLESVERTFSPSEEAPNYQGSLNNGILVQEPAGDAWECGGSSSTDTDEDGELIQRAMKAKEKLLKEQELRARNVKSRRSSSSRPRSGGVTLKLLIDEGLLQPGAAVLSIEYRGLHEQGDLLTDGRIKWKDKIFESPSAFSIFVKRIVNPTRKADDGWKTVKFAGKYLDHYKLELVRKRFGPLVDGLADNGSDIDSDSVVKRARVTDCSALMSANIEPGVSGSGEINVLPVSEQQGASSLLLQGAQMACPPQALQDIDSGRDEGLKASDSLIHTKMFPGEATLIHPSMLLEYGFSGRVSGVKERGREWAG